MCSWTHLLKLIRFVLICRVRLTFLSMVKENKRRNCSYLGTSLSVSCAFLVLWSSWFETVDEILFKKILKFFLKVSWRKSTTHTLDEEQSDTLCPKQNITKTEEHALIQIGTIFKTDSALYLRFNSIKWLFSAFYGAFCPAYLVILEFSENFPPNLFCPQNCFDFMLFNLLRSLLSWLHYLEEKKQRYN